MAKKHGFIVTTFFMIGNLGETEETVRQSIDFALELDPHIAQFSVATPYPGTEMYSTLKSQNRILSENWDYYDYFSPETPLFEHEFLKTEDMARLLKQAYRKFYLRPKVILRTIGSVTNTQGIFKLLRGAGKLFKMIH